jgi:hypothetical protein
MKLFRAIRTPMLARFHREHWVGTELVTFTHWDEVGMEGKSLLVVIATRRATEGKKNGALLIVLFAVSPTTKFGVGTAEKF